MPSSMVLPTLAAMQVWHSSQSPAYWLAQLVRTHSTSSSGPASAQFCAMQASRSSSSSTVQAGSPSSVSGMGSGKTASGNARAGHFGELGGRFGGPDLLEEDHVRIEPGECFGHQRLAFGRERHESLGQPRVVGGDAERGCRPGCRRGRGGRRVGGLGGGRRHRGVGSRRIRGRVVVTTCRQEQTDHDHERCEPSHGPERTPDREILRILASGHRDELGGTGDAAAELGSAERRGRAAAETLGEHRAHDVDDVGAGLWGQVGSAAPKAAVWREANVAKQARA